ncbi:MAG: hypothetical protein IT424_15085 [Pirellulales bacterium]|nr:hypothetical protein [Pirellulales bacterium]
MNVELSSTDARRLRGGLSLVEVVVSTTLVSLVLLGAMDLLGAVTRDRTSTGDTVRGHLLAQQLMTEILASAYVDGDSSPLFGPELGEASGNRTNFDDVDDYHGWTASPPQERSGAALANSTGWRQSVTVQYVTAANPATTSLVDGGVKRITVRIQRNAQTVAKLVALRTNKY